MTTLSRIAALTADRLAHERGDRATGHPARTFAAMVENQVFRCPLSNKTGVDSYRVLFDGRVCSPDFNSKGAAAAYLDLLEGGRKPEYSR